MKIKIEHEVILSTRIMYQAVNNLIEANKIQELSRIIGSMNYEIYLQKKFYEVRDKFPVNFPLKRGMLKESTDYFLSKSRAVCESYDFACSTNIDFDSLRYLLKDLIDNEREDIICMLCSKLSLEIILQMQENKIKEINLPTYLISKEDKADASEALFETIQELNDRYPDSKEEGDGDIPF